jgi:hypothetical protein
MDVLHNTDDLVPRHARILAEPFAKRSRRCAPELTGKILGNQDEGAQAVDLRPRDLAARNQPRARRAEETG